MNHRSFRFSRPFLATLLFTASAAVAQAQPLDVVVSILPQTTIVQGVAGDLATVTVMVPPGMHPRTFEPTPAQMADLEDTDLYVAIDLPHERNWMPQVEAARPDLTILHLRNAVETRTITGRVDQSGKEMVDPHIWLAAPQLRDIATSIRDALTTLDPGNAKTYAANTAAWIARLDAADAEAAEKLAPYAGRAFLVFHPAWGYLADSYGLRQIAIEEHGMEPGPKMIAKTIDTARAEDIHVIFVQQQFSQAEAKTIAAEIDGKVVTLDPFNPDPVDNLNIVADAFVASFQ